MRSLLQRLALVAPFVLLVVGACDRSDGWAGRPPASDRVGDTESYEHLPDNRFLDPGTDRHSTFAIDVDTASYANVRRFLREGRLPEPAAVRVEEMVNYFDYDYPRPTSDAPFSLVAEVADCPWNPGNRLVQIGIRGRDVESRRAPALNLVFLLDVSGSMNEQGKLPLVQSALRLVAKRLRREDRLSIVCYSSDAWVELEPTSGDRREEILDALGRLRANGSTNGEGGLRLAYETASRGFLPHGTNRIVMATDGDFNVGATTRDDLLRLVDRERDRGIYLTVLGFGTGNLKDDNLELLADHGDGNYAYLDSLSEARKVLVEEAMGTLVTIAKDVKVQVEFNPARVRGYRLVGYENRILAAEDFGDDRIDGGEIGSGHTVTALYEIELQDGVAPRRERHVEPLRYGDDRSRGGVREHTGDRDDELMWVKLRYQSPDGGRSRLTDLVVPDVDRRPSDASDDFRFAAAVAAFGQQLRGSEHVRRTRLADIESLARGALGRDRGGHRSEFVRMVADARSLTDR